MNEYFLTIGIPTWNRFPYLQENIEQLLQEIKKIPDARVEILISDNASTDGTQTYCESLAAQYSFFTYIRNASNVGANKNFQQVIEKASGVYVWLLGDDDKIVEDCLNRIISDSDEHHPGIVIGGCLNDQSKERIYPPFIQTSLLTDKKIVSQYDLIRLAGKISVLIFKKEMIMPVLAQAESMIKALKTPWPHLLWLMLLLNSGRTILFLSYGTNYFIEKNRYNLLQDGIAGIDLLVKEYAAIIYQCNDDKLLTPSFYSLLARSITFHRSWGFLKIVAYTTYLNAYFPAVKNAWRNLVFVKGLRNKSHFFVFYVLPVLLPICVRKLVFLTPAILFPRWVGYKKFLHYLRNAKILLDKNNQRQVYDKDEL